MKNIVLTMEAWCIHLSQLRFEVSDFCLDAFAQQLSLWYLLYSRTLPHWSHWDWRFFTFNSGLFLKGGEITLKTIIWDLKIFTIKSGAVIAGFHCICFLVADIRLQHAVLVGWQVGWLVHPSVRLSITFLNFKRFLHYCSCPTVRDCPAVYPALLI